MFFSFPSPGSNTFDTETCTSLLVTSPEHYPLVQISLGRIPRNRRHTAVVDTYFKVCVSTHKNCRVFFTNLVARPVGTLLSAGRPGRRSPRRSAPRPRFRRRRRREGTPPRAAATATATAPSIGSGKRT